MTKQADKIERVRISTAAADRAQSLQRRFPELEIGWIHRIAALLSLKRNGYLRHRPSDIDSDPNRPSRYPGRLELRSAADRPILFPTLIRIVAAEPLSSGEIADQLWYQIHLGSRLLEEVSRECRTLEDLYRALLEEVPEGLETFVTPSKPLPVGTISLIIGRKNDDSDYSWPINDTSIVDNPHSAVVGVSGQGKTQFVLDLLLQLAEQDSDLSFTVLDYKGDLSDADSRVREVIEHDLDCELTIAGKSPLPTVPFQRGTTQDIEQYSLGMTDLLGKLYPRLGTQQRLALRESLCDLLADQRYENGFGFRTLEEHLRFVYEQRGRRDDGLIEVISRLAVLRIFEEKPSSTSSAPLMGRSNLIRLNELVADSLPVAFLIINRIYDEMKRLPDVVRQGSIVHFRHAIFIDEAHHYLPIRSSPLTGLIREGRSKGVAVFLATQSISDLATAAGTDYRDFLSNVFFFKTNVSSASEIRALIPTTSRRVQMVADILPELEPGQVLFTRHLEKDLRSSLLRAVQFYRR